MRWKDLQCHSRRASKETPTGARKGRSASVAATDSRNRKVDFVLADLSCRAESRHLLLFASAARKRKQTIRDSSTSVGMTITCATASDEPQLARVWKFAQKRIVARWSKVLDYPAEDRIQERARMHDVQVERHELAA